MARKFIDEYGNTASLERFSDGRWMVDMGCSLLNRFYKSERMALRYLDKNGYSEIKGAEE